jgi:hypothetical protein
MGAVDRSTRTGNGRASHLTDPDDLTWLAWIWRVDACRRAKNDSWVYARQGCAFEFAE